jgi:hypothetical protein
MHTVTPSEETPVPVNDAVRDLLDFDYEQELPAFVRAIAPRVFAVVSEHTDEDGEKDACVLAWGFEFEDGRARVGEETRTSSMVLSSAESAVRRFERLTRGPVRLEWLETAA